MAGFVTGIIALLAILFLLPYLYYLPKAVLSSVIFIAVLYIIFEAPEDIHFMFKIGAWRDFTLFCLTFLATVGISLEFGTLLAVALSLLLTIKETSYPRITIMVRNCHGIARKHKLMKADFNLCISGPSQRNSQQIPTD
jgi:MFS superfamily sulfate permease-like transporter